ncbi:hypothetical protein [Streptomyces buecherae]|uniref:Uncharacterized protein n=1 Tax=Streptomyces buecherae TaxID=2763006 RepID=A0A7H8NGX6_9ACTN|nr:hypothetical protein [Streptomyces buecherae]QKW53670.1 hypothetical protein HUT08_33630 [Streptomyces buecherae]
MQPVIEYGFYGAVAAARVLLPAMRAAGAGTLLFTTGGGSVDPVPMFGNANAAQAAPRNRVVNLNKELAGSGVHAAHVASNVWSAGAARKAARRPPPSRSPPCTGTCTNTATVPRPSSTPDGPRRA